MDARVAKGRVQDIKSVSAQMAGTEMVFISGPPSGATWSKNDTNSVYGVYRGTDQVHSIRVDKGYCALRSEHAGAWIDLLVDRFGLLWRQVRGLINEEFIDTRFPFFVKFDGLCLYRDLRNEEWAIDATGAGRTANGYYGKTKGPGSSLPTEPTQWQCRMQAPGASVWLSLSFFLLQIYSEKRSHLSSRIRYWSGTARPYHQFAQVRRRH